MNKHLMLSRRYTSRPDGSLCRPNPTGRRVSSCSTALMDGRSQLFYNLLLQHRVKLTVCKHSVCWQLCEF